jgi:hypothetical protein
MPSGYGGNRTHHLDFLAGMESVKPGIGLRFLERGEHGAEAPVVDRYQGITRKVIGGSVDDSANGYRLAAMSGTVIGQLAGANPLQRKLFLRSRGERQQRREQRRHHPRTSQTARYWACNHGSGFLPKKLSMGSSISGK